MNDTWFLTSPGKYKNGDKNIAKLGIALASLAYGTKSEVKKGLESLQFTGISMFNYDKKPKESDDTVAFSISSRSISDGTSRYDLVLVNIRGTVGNEWHSNFRIGGVKSDHHGFTIAANQVTKELKTYIKTNKFQKNSLKILFVGHSRGAAVANIMAGGFTISESLAKKDNIFAYLYATPNVSWAELKTCNNIFNYIYEGDFVPHIPLSGKNWEYKKYGRVIALKANTDAKNYFKSKTNEKFNAFTLSERKGLIKTFKTAVPSVAMYDAEYGQKKLNWIKALASSLSSEKKTGKVAVGPKKYALDKMQHSHAQITYISLIEKSL